MKIRLLFVIILLAALTTLYFGDMLFSGKVFAYRDIGRHTYPFRLFTISSIKSGIIPLWNPYILCGAPHLASQQGAVFYPLNLIYFLFPFVSVFNIFLILHVFLAGLFTFFLSRRWGFGLSSAIISSATFMFSGYIISILNLATTLNSVIWFPAALLFLDKGLAEKDMRWALTGSLFIAVMFMGGEPSIAYTALWALLFYSAAFWANNKERIAFKKVFVLYIVMASAAVLLISVQLLPLMEFLKLSDRITRATYKAVTLWSLPLRETLDFFIPFFSRIDFAKEAYWHQQNWVYAIYIGVSAALLPLAAVFLRWKDWRVRFLCFIGALFLLISYGGHTPFYYIIYKFIPGFKFIRYPVRFLYITTFAVAMLCGAGFEAYVEKKKNNKEALEAFFRPVLYILCLAAIVLLALHIRSYDVVTAGLKFFSAKNALFLRTLIIDIKNIGRFFGFFLPLGIILFLGFRLKVRSGIIGFAAASLVIADLLSATPPHGQYLVDKSIFTAPTPNIEYLQNDKSYFRFFVSPKINSEKYFVGGKTYQEAIYNTKDMLIANYPMPFGLYNAGGYDSLSVGVCENVIQLAAGRSPSEMNLLNALNVKYVIADKDFAAKGYRLVRHDRAYIYENTNVLGRAFLVKSFRVLKKEADIADRLKSKEFDPAREVILEEEPDVVLDSAKNLVVEHGRDAKFLASLEHEKAEFVKYSPNEVIIRAAVNSPKFLVLSDTYYPGWKAFVDGKRVKIYKADYMLRAVHLRQGEHTVKFIFDPFTFKLGAAISLITLLFIAVYIVIIRK